MTSIRPLPTRAFSKPELERIEQRALELGAVKHATLDIEQEYYEKSIRYMIFGNVLRNGTYPISVSSERIFQAIASSNTPSGSEPTRGPRLDRCGQRPGALRPDVPDPAPEIEIITRRAT